MTIPITILEIEIALALLYTAYSWFAHDKNNYTDVISGVVGTVFWWTSGLTVLNGVQSESVEFSSTWMMWILVGIGVITALITFTKIVDVFDKRNHVDMSFDSRF